MGHNMEGWAEKRALGRSRFGRKNWKRRFLSLDDNYFTYWTKPHGCRKGFCPTQMLEDPQKVERQNTMAPGHYLQITMNRNLLLLRFREEEERDQWYEVFHKASQGESIFECPFLRDIVTPRHRILHALDEPDDVKPSLDSRISRHLSGRKSRGTITHSG